MRRFAGIFIVTTVVAGAAIVGGMTSAASDRSTDQRTTPKPVAETVFRNPINTSADPTVVFHNGKYFMATTQGDRIRMWHSPSIASLINAPFVDVWQDSDPSRNQQMWAPGLYHFNDRWYIYYTASDGVDANHRNYVIESVGDDPLGPYTFKARIADAGEYGIDGEPFTHNGQLYYAWAGPGRGQGGPAQVWAMRLENPWTAVGVRVALPVNNGGCTEVREGPTTLQRNGRTFLTYSTCDTGKPDYQLWMISIPDGADPLVAANWTQYPNSVFSRNDAAGTWGPGHHFFFTSPDGTEDWIAYHGKNTTAYNYGWRTTRAQKFTWNGDGTPNFGSPVALGEAVPLPAGDPGPGSRAINDVDEGTGDFQVSYTGTWNKGTQCANQCFNGDDHWSNVAGNTATFHFTGTQIALFSVRDVGNGMAAMSIDGGAEVEVDYYGNPRVGQHLNYLSPVLPAGAHTLTVRVTGKPTGGSGAFVSIDRAEVWP
jgi:GH43 family beta-xylosidase